MAKKTCQGKTLSGEPCNNAARDDGYCYLASHTAPPKKARKKPSKKAAKKVVSEKEVAPPWQPKVYDRVTITGVAFVNNAPNQVVNMKGTVTRIVDREVTVATASSGSVRTDRVNVRACT